MSANLIVDVRDTTRHAVSVVAPGGGSGIGPGTIIGQVIDFLDANTLTNINIMGGGMSGVFKFQVQTADVTTSGSFTDPVSGYPEFPTPGGILSGGIIVVNSGLRGSGLPPELATMSGSPPFCSGGNHWASFQRPHRYARLNYLSGGFGSGVGLQFGSGTCLVGGFVGQKKTTSSGGGFSFSPGSGSVSV